MRLHNPLTASAGLAEDRRSELVSHVSLPPEPGREIQGGGRFCREHKGSGASLPAP